MEFDEIQMLLEEQGEGLRRFRTDAVRLTIPGGVRDYPLYVYQDGVFVVLSLIPFMRLPKERDAALRLSAWLLRQNAAEVWTKFSVDEDGDVILSIEVRGERLTRKRFERALKILRRSADQYWKAIGEL